MKPIFKSLLVGTALATTLAACSPDNHDLQTPSLTADDLAEGIAFSITHDANNPNIVYLKSLLPSQYQIAWETPQGRSIGTERTLKIPFDGEYKVRMGVNTRGGYVWSNPADFNVADFCAEFVDHYLWTRISGGVGNSKTWQFDLATLEDGSYKTTMWKGPHWYWNPNYTWNHLHASAETDSYAANYVDSEAWDKADAIDPSDVPDPDGGDPNWYWAADWVGNQWMIGESERKSNYGYMTFDLINGANVTITDADGTVVGKGTYLLDVDNHTISFSDVTPLNNTPLTCRNYKVLYLSDNGLQLIEDGITSGSATSYNYVTKDYFENYVADTAEPEPSLPDNWMNDISQTVITTVKWVLSDKNPLDWANLDGSLMNGWSSSADYPDWLGTPDPASYADFSMTLDCKDNSAVFHYPDGSEVACQYTLDEKGIYTFSEPVPGFTVVGWAWFNVDANNGLRITAIEKDLMGNVSGMWLGARSTEKDEYIVYHFVPTAGSNGGSSEDAITPWIAALCGKTFTPNTDAFVDWMNFDFSGGWTAPSSFGSDYSSNGWVWTEEVAKVAESARLSFTNANGQIMASLSYTMFDGTKVEESGIVTVNNDNPSLTFPFPMVNYDGTAASWVGTVNNIGAYWTKPLEENEWLWVSHAVIGNNLTNVDEKGFWLGRVSNAVGAGNDKDEIISFWWKLVE